MHPRMTTDDPTLDEVIRAQHREISGLLDALAGEQRVTRREGLVTRLGGLLERHARAEDAVLYDLLTRDERTRPLAERARQEHAEVRRLLGVFDDMAGDDERWDAAVAALARTVRDHVAIEERVIFPAVRRLLDHDQARALAEAFQSIAVGDDQGERDLRVLGRSSDASEPAHDPRPGQLLGAPEQFNYGTAGGLGRSAFTGQSDLASGSELVGGYAEGRPDDSIAGDVRHVFTHSPELDTSDVELHVDAGAVTLTGTVPDRVTQRRIADMVSAISGVRDIVNHLRVRSRAS